MTPDNNKPGRDEQLEQMEKIFEAERAKHGYSIDDPVDPIRNKSGSGRLFGAILVTAILTAVLALLISVVASQNSGVAIDFSALFG